MKPECQEILSILYLKSLRTSEKFRNVGVCALRVRVPARVEAGRVCAQKGTGVILLSLFYYLCYKLFSMILKAMFSIGMEGCR